MLRQLLINLALVGRRPTGIANYALNLVPALGLEHTTLLLPEHPEAPLLKDLPYPHQRYPIANNLSPDNGKWGHLRRLGWTQFQLPRFCSRFECPPLLFSPAPEAPLFAGCRFVVMVHDLIPLRFPNWRSPLTPYFRYYVPQVLAQAEHILCNSRTTADEMMQIYGIPAHRLTAIPLAHDAAHFRPLGLPPQPYFVYLGRSDPHKNLPRLLEAFAHLPQRRNYQLWLVGSTDRRYTPALQAQAEELGITTQIRWLDYVPYQDLPKILNQAIALVFPSLWEGFGLPVLEAMACGTPVITSQVAALPEVAGDAALLVDPRRVEAIAAALHQVATDARTRSDLSAAGLQRAQHFSWNKTGQQTAAILQQYC